MNNKRFLKALGLIIVVALLAAALPLQAKAQGEAPQTLNVASWTGPTDTGVDGRETVLKVGDTYHMWYYNSAEAELFYTSSDDPASFDAGESVTFTGGAPVEVNSVSVVKEGETFYMIAYGGDDSEFAYYTSDDGSEWTKGSVIFDGTGKFTNFVKIDAPFLFKLDSGYRLYFQVKTGTGATERYHIYAAESSTIGGIYTLVNGGNPVLSPDPDITKWDGKYVMHPWVVKDGDVHYMWYSAHNSVDPQRLGMAKSADGIHWVKSPGNPIMLRTTGYSEPSVIKDGNTWQMWTVGSTGNINYLTASGPFEFSTIQAASDAASAGGIILVWPGTYVETATLLIEKPLTLKAATTGVKIGPTRDTPPSPPPPAVENSVADPLIKITSLDVNLVGLTLQNADVAVEVDTREEDDSWASLTSTAHWNIEYCRFEGITTTNIVNLTDFKVMAENNWWDSAEGPEPGTIIGDVDYVPWLKISGLTLSENEIEENQPIGTKVGTFGFEPEDELDPDEVYTLALVDTAHYPDNAKFAIDGYDLKTAAGLNYEEKTTYTIYVRATDPWDSIYEQEVKIYVLDVNEPPTLTLEFSEDYEGEIKEEVPFSFIAIGTDVDEGQILDYTLVNAPEGMDFADSQPISGQKTIEWTPNEEQGPGEYTFSVKVCDDATEEEGGQRCAEQPVTIIVKEVNKIPEAEDDTYAILGDAPRTIPAPGVLANDTDEDFPPNTLRMVLQTNVDPGDGTLSWNANGAFTFTPKPGWDGQAEFTYKVNDGNASSIDFATVTLNKWAQNYIPSDIKLNDVSSPGPVSVNENVNFEGVLSTVDGNVGDIFTYSLVDGVGGDDNEEFDIDGDELVGGPFNYEEKSSYSVRIRSTDQFGASVEKFFTINVIDQNDAPVVNPIGDKEVDEKELLTFTATATDEDGDGLTFSLDDQPAGAGIITVPGVGGIFTWTPTEDQDGVHTFNVCVSDGSGEANHSDCETITVKVNEVNIPPVANNQAVSVLEDHAGFAITLTGSDADYDPEDELIYSIVSEPTHGDLTYTVDGLPTVTYKPDEDYNGPDSFTFEINDGHEDSNIATVSITVTPVNDAPSAVADSYNVLKGVSLNIAAPGVLGNDEDIDEDALTAVIAVNASHGNVTLNLDGSFTYIPNADFAGEDSFQYFASDGTVSSDQVTVTLKVKESNVAPTDIGLSSNLVPENSDSGYVVGTLTATDEPGDEHTFSLVTGEGSDDNGEFEIQGEELIAKYQFNFEVKKTYKVRIAATDQLGASFEKAFVITVTDANDAPVAEGQPISAIMDEAVDFELTGSDEDGDELTFAIFTEPQHGTLDVQEVEGANFAGAGVLRVIEPTVTYTPEADFTGPDSFTFKVMDEKGAVSNLATVTITVNDVPVAVDDEYETDEDVPLEVTVEEGVLANDTDSYPEEEPLTAILVTDVSHGELTLAGDGSFSYLPDPNFFGEDSFTYKASDSLELESEPATVTITIAAVNDEPVAENISAETDEETAVEIELLASDVDDDELTAAIVEEPEHGEVVLEGFKVTYTPELDFNGTDSFTYKVNDGTADSNIATVTITIAAVNDAPVAEDIEDAETDEDKAVEIELLASDVDGDELTAEIVVEPEHGEVTIDGLVATYTPEADFNGTDSFTYKVNDGTVDSNEATVSITIAALNDAPVAEDIEAETDEETAVEIELLASDVDGDELTAAIVEEPEHGEVVLEGFKVTYTPELDFNGTDSFTYKVNDGTADSNIATVTITVGAINDEPNAVDDAYDAWMGQVLEIPAPGVLANDIDPDPSDVQTVEVKDAPLHGELVLNEDGSFTYEPAAGFYGVDTFTYWLISEPAVQSAYTDWATVTITVRPVARIFLPIILK